MIARYLSRLASRWLSSRKPDPRDAIRAKARQMCERMGKPVPEALRRG
jgi:hypothetical protein